MWRLHPFVVPIISVPLTPPPPKPQEDAAAAGRSSGGSSSSKQDGKFASPQQRLLFSLLDSYADVFHAAKPYPGGPGWRLGQPDACMDAVLLHVLNHCAKTADVIKKNNDRLKGADPGKARL
jgi:hypothetical protein